MIKDDPAFLSTPLMNMHSHAANLCTYSDFCHKFNIVECFAYEFSYLATA